MQYSVLMSVYISERPEFIDECLKSLASQTLKADEIIIVEDGPLSEEVRTTIDGWERELPIKRLALTVNVGLGLALNKGLAICKNELVARMDTDDICSPNRFQLQVNRFLSDPNVDILGGTIAEFESNIHKIDNYRTVPTGKEINRYIKYRNPINHMTVMFKKSAITSAGGYLDLMFMEDYYLWIRCFKNGCQIDNLEDVLVYARTGNGMHSRRRGSTYIRSELALHKIRRKYLGVNFLINFSISSIRIVPRLLTSRGVQFIYNSILRK